MTTKDAYRDETAGARMRVDEALQAHERARARIDEQLEAIGVLDAQLRGRGLPAVDAPEVPHAPLILGDRDKLADLVRWAGELEDDTTRLASASEDLSRLFTMLQDRVQGKSGDALRLGAPPRALPLSYVISEWLGGVCLITKVTIFFPPVWALPFYSLEVALGCLALFASVATIRTVRRLGMLRWGKVAQQVTVMNEEGTGTENTNVPMRRSEGWEVTTEAYTGSTMKTTLDYFTEEGARHSLKVRGMGYYGGVVLYDSRKPERATAIEKFDCTPHPDFQGAWERGLRGKRVWVTSAFGLATIALLLFAILHQLH